VPTMDEIDVFAREATAVALKAMQQGIARETKTRDTLYQGALDMIRRAARRRSSSCRTDSSGRLLLEIAHPTQRGQFDGWRILGSRRLYPADALKERTMATSGRSAEHEERLMSSRGRPASASAGKKAGRPFAST